MGTIQSCIFLLLCCSILSQLCPESIPISVALSSKTCNYHFKQSNNDCSFIVCSYQQSSKSQIQNHGWSQCFSECCSSIDLPDNTDTIQLLLSCQDANVNKSKTMKILLFLFIAIILALIFLFVLCINKKTCPLYKLVRNREGENDTQIPHRAIQHNSGLEQLANAFINRTDAHLDVQNKEPTLADFLPVAQSRKLHDSKVTKNMKILQAKCGICFDIKPFCELNCGHIFHDKCLGQWFEGNRVVGPCGEGNIKIVRVYCQNCYNEIGIYSIHRFKSKYRKNKSFICQICRSAQRGN